MLIDDIKEKMDEARKSRKDISTLLVTLYSEASMVGKNNGNRKSTDNEVIQTIKKFIKNIDENLTYKIKNIERLKLEYEKKFLTCFLPEQLDESKLRIEIINIIRNLGIVKDIKNMGKVMAKLKEYHDGKYDGKLASRLVKEELVS